MDKHLKEALKYARDTDNKEIEKLLFRQVALRDQIDAADRDGNSDLLLKLIAESTAVIQTIAELASEVEKKNNQG